MKKVKSLFISLIAVLLVIPFSVFADEKKDPVPVYLFHGSTCPHCLETIEWFESIEEEYGDYFDLIKYEVWENETNAQFMQEVAAKQGDEVSGVPYLIVGEYSFPNGFGPDSPVDSTGKTMADDMIEKIMETYDAEERVDIMDGLENIPTPDKPAAKKEEKKNGTNDAIVGTVTVLIIGGVVAAAIFVRKSNK